MPLMVLLHLVILNRIFQIHFSTLAKFELRERQEKLHLPTSRVNMQGGRSRRLRRAQSNSECPRSIDPRCYLRPSTWQLWIHQESIDEEPLQHLDRAPSPTKMSSGRMLEYWRLVLTFSECNHWRNSLQYLHIFLFDRVFFSN